MQWLMKSEPDVFSLDHLAKDKTTLWSGVRNFQARNFMMNDMKLEEPVLFYHSSCEPPGIAGLAVISKTSIPDPTQFDPKSDYYEKRATKEKPMWFCVEVKFVKKFKNFITLEEIRNNKDLSEMLVIRRGQRLSIQPVEKKHFDLLKKLGEA